MAIVSPERQISDTIKEGERAVYVSFDAEGKCLSVVQVDSDFDMTLTSQQLEKAGGCLRRVKDSSVPFKIESGIPLEEVTLAELEACLEPETDYYPANEDAANFSLEALAAAMSSADTNEQEG